MISVSTRRLSVFKSVVDRGGFNLAAVELGISQPSVGAHIKALEAQLGQPLFLRSRGRRPALTKAGEEVYAYAVDVLQKSQVTTQVLAEIRSSTGRELTVAVHRDIAPHFLPARLTAFRTRHPQVRVSPRIGTIDEIIAQVRAQTATMGIFPAGGPVAGMRSEVIDRVQLVLVVSPRHALARRRQITAATLAQFPFVTGLHGSSYAALTRAVLKSIGVESFEVTMECEESIATMEMVRHGLGIACLPLCTAAPELAARTLVELKTQPPLPDLELRCGYVGSLPQSARDFLSAGARGKAAKE